jgi:hypothetical protein
VRETGDTLTLLGCESGRVTMLLYDVAQRRIEPRPGP